MDGVRCFHQDAVFWYLCESEFLLRLGVRQGREIMGGIGCRKRIEFVSSFSTVICSEVAKVQAFRLLPKNRTTEQVLCGQQGDHRFPCLLSETMPHASQGIRVGLCAREKIVLLVGHLVATVFVGDFVTSQGRRIHGSCVWCTSSVGSVNGRY
jgi:hypothetical protein